MQQTWAGAKKNQNSQGSGVLSFADRPLPDTAVVVFPPFTPPMRPACADDDKNQNGRVKVPLRFGRGLLAVAARSLPDTRTVVPVPFTPPPSRVQVDTLNDQVGKQTGDKVQVNVELGDGQALDVVVSSPCIPNTRRFQPTLNTPDAVVMAERPLAAECIYYVILGGALRAPYM